MWDSYKTVKNTKLNFKMNKLQKDQLRKVVILGHTGFIGQHLDKFFRRNSPQVEVIGKDLPDLDLTSEDSVRRLADLFTFDTGVIMLSCIKRQFGDTLDIFNQNLKMATNLCRLLKERPVRRLIYFSSSAVYGEDIHNVNITEETSVDLRSYYGMVKFITERLLWKTTNLYKGCSLLIMRPPTIYGDGDSSDSYGPVKFLNAALKDEEIILWGDGTELREFMFIDDIVDIAYQLMFSSYGGVVNLVSGVSYSFGDVLKAIESVVGRTARVNHRPRTKDKIDNVFCNNNLLRAIGTYTFTPLVQGIKALYEDSSMTIT